jgi:hypothetical protein
MSTRPAPDDPKPDVLLTRRRLVEMAGVTLVGTALCATGAGAAWGAQRAPRFPAVPRGAVRPENVAGVGVGTLNGGTRPVYVTRPASRDPVEHSVADTLFWGEQLMEHSMFIAMMMPGLELARPRGRAERFQRDFAAHLALLRRSRLDRSDYARFNRTTIGLTRSLIDYKQRMSQEQSSGRMRSLVWPTFFDHTRHEAERFVRRLTQLNGGDTAYSRGEVVPFWSNIMGEHAQFISQLLDPEEEALILAARETSETFRRIGSDGGSRRAGVDPVMEAVNGIIDFKTAAERGIQEGRIKSIIHPALADHVRREAVRFRDELQRTA